MSHLPLEQLQNEINRICLQLELPGLSKEFKKELKGQLHDLECELEERQGELMSY